MKSYTVGTLVRLLAKVNVVVSGALEDPTTVIAKVRTPDRTVVEVSSVRDSRGVYHADYLPTVTGLHMYQFIATGDVQSAGVGQFLVTQDTF